MANAKDKFIKDLEIRGRAKTTQESYLDSLERLEDYYSPKKLSDLSDDEVQEFIYHMVMNKLSWSYINVHVSFFRFFYGTTLRKNLNQFVIPCPKMKKALPQYMSREEIGKALAHVAWDPKQSAFFQILYGCGLRGAEACMLRMGDIDSGNETLWVRNGKGGKDRGVYLPKAVYKILASYWRASKFKDYLFPGFQDQTKPMVIQRPRNWFREVKSGVGITKKGALHMWRHSYATHMLQDGFSLHTIMRRLGHTSIKTTMIYLHLAGGRDDEKGSPIDQLFD